MRVSIIILILFVSTIAVAQQQKGIISDSMLEKTDINYRFFGVDYKYVAPQMPVSENYNLKGLEIFTGSLNADISYAWKLDKKKENSVLLAKIMYSNIITKYSIAAADFDRIDTSVPKYIYQIPDIHYFGLSFLFLQQIKTNWLLIAGYDLVLSSDLERKINQKDFNSTALFLLQKTFKSLVFGIGSAVYVINNKIKVFPIANMAYFNHKINIEFTAPLSFTANYKFNKKTNLGLDINLVLSGFKVHYDNTSLQITHLPDYINSNGFNFSLNFDRKFYQTFHYRISTGYIYREIFYLKSGDNIDKLVFKDGLSLSLSIYSTF